MIESLRSHPDGSELAGDVCIIGAGPAGLALARELVAGNTRVLLVESGGETPEADAQTLNRGTVVDGSPYQGLEAGRVRAFGGTSWTWTGQCLPLGPEAFRARPWAPETQWPLEEGELSPYYRRAAGFFDLEPDSWSRDMRRPFGISAPELDDSVLGLRGPALTGTLQLGPKYMPEFRRAPRLTVLVNATVTGLRLSPSGDAIAGAEVATLDGRRARVHAKTFVLAAGAFENVRLLLLCPQLRDRLWALGRYFQDHPLGQCARVEPVDRVALQNAFAVCRRRGRRYGVRLRLADEAQRRAEVLACEAAVVWPQPRGVLALRRLAAGGRSPRTVARDLWTVARDARELPAAAARYRRGLSSAAAYGPMSLVVFSEQAPDPESRLTLSRERDPLGLPRLCLDWRVGEAERRTMIAMVEAVGAEFRRLGLGAVRPEEWLDDPDAWRSRIEDTYHPAGATRMGSDAADSVVDADCRVHGLSNGFVVGSSVFRGVGAANPTLTVVALAIRLADRLKAFDGGV